jgi:hydrogenase maturation protease
MALALQILPGSMEDGKVSVLVLGIGNLLWADEGFGVRAVEALQRQYDCGPDVALMDGGTQGLYLVQYVQAADRLIVFDAIDYGLEPGTLKLVVNEDVPLFMGAKKMSLHQTGFQEVLAAAKLTGSYPGELILIGVQPADLEDYGGSLTATVKEKIPEAIEVALGYLRSWGASVRPRTEQDSVEPLNPAMLDIERYEAERPTPEEACRFGDARFLVQPPGGDV